MRPSDCSVGNVDVKRATYFDVAVLQVMIFVCREYDRRMLCYDIVTHIVADIDVTSM